MSVSLFASFFIHLVSLSAGFTYIATKGHLFWDVF